MYCKLFNDNPQNVNVLPSEPWKIPPAQMTENANARPVIPEPNVTNVTMDTLKDPMEVVKNVIVNLLDR